MALSLLKGLGEKAWALFLGAVQGRNRTSPLWAAPHPLVFLECGAVVGEYWDQGRLLGAGCGHRWGPHVPHWSVHL